MNIPRVPLRVLFAKRPMDLLSTVFLGERDSKNLDLNDVYFEYNALTDPEVSKSETPSTADGHTTLNSYCDDETPLGIYTDEKAIIRLEKIRLGTCLTCGDRYKCAWQCALCDLEHCFTCSAYKKGQHVCLVCCNKYIYNCIVCSYPDYTHYEKKLIIDDIIHYSGAPMVCGTLFKMPYPLITIIFEYCKPVVEECASYTIDDYFY